MAKKKTSKKTPKNTTDQPSLLIRTISFFKDERTLFVLGLIVLLFSFYLFFAFISFFFTGAADQSRLDNVDMAQLRSIKNEIQNWTGVQGAYIANLFINKWFGISSFSIFIFLIALSFKLMKIKAFSLIKAFFYSTIILIWGSLFFGFFFINSYTDTFLYLGGAHGYYLSLWLNANIGAPGTFLLILAILLIFLVFTNKNTIEFIRKILNIKLNIIPKKNSSKEEELDIDEFEEDKNNIFSSEHPLVYNDFEPQEQKNNIVTRKFQNEEPITEEMVSVDKNDDIPADSEFEITIAKDEEYQLTDQEALTLRTNRKNDEENDDYDASELGEYDPTLDLSNYQSPSLSLLKRYDNNTVTPEQIREEQNANKKRIIETLGHYGIGITSIKATVGPTITLYEIIPEPGVRISKIRNLEDDIALSLSALGIRIIAPIPGKGTIGIEVPNKEPQIVSMQSIIASKKFQETSYDLPIALGKTITNEIFMVDLCKMPHVLVAGATGQGKSVGLNAIITSLLYKKHPSQLKFVLIDPKKVEFNIYSSIEKHFLAKLPDGEEAIITDVTKVVQTLNSLTREMDDRYDLLKKAHVRNAKEYNNKFINRRLNPEKGHRFLPYIVVIIDEFGDLIMTAGKEVELPIARIAQLARAIGIHMIIATQRPTTNIITGTIKANFPARVAFRVSSMIDSRTILDCPGANQLIGRGDMLFSQGGELIRVQCAFVDTPEAEDIASSIGEQQAYPTAYYLPEYVGDGEDGGALDVDMTKLDPLFEEAARLIVAHQQGSTSLIQRKFSIGYNRAGRIVDQLEAANIIGPFEGSKARQVLVDSEYHLEQILAKM
ncbi:MAG: DNA translocase FtsK [Candidatus Azobacteroides sp.]|nr:DNA translocase FtsK [Candidatus Azobacteroides sp.]